MNSFYPWDEIVLQNMLPYFLTNSSLPSSPNADELNYHSSQLARNNRIQHTIEKCIRIRTELVETLNQLPEDMNQIHFFLKMSPKQINGNAVISTFPLYYFKKNPLVQSISLSKLPHSPLEMTSLFAATLF